MKPSNQSGCPGLHRLLRESFYGEHSLLSLNDRLAPFGPIHCAAYSTVFIASSIIYFVQLLQ